MWNYVSIMICNPGRPHVAASTWPCTYYRCCCWCL